MAVATSTVIAAAALAATAVSGYQQYQAASEAADAREEAQRIQGAQQQIQQRRRTRQAIREERIRRARILQAAENTGVAGSSGQFGAVGALGTLTGANVGASRGTALAAEGITRQGQRASDAQQRGQLFGAIGQLSSSVFSTAASSQGFQSDFGRLFDQGGSQPVQGGFTSEIF